MQPINIHEDCQFLKDLEHSAPNSGINKGMWNLITSKRDLSLFCKGIMPHRKWRLKHVRDYFGLFDTHKKEDVKNALDLLESIVNN